MAEPPDKIPGLPQANSTNEPPVGGSVPPVGRGRRTTPDDVYFGGFGKPPNPLPRDKPSVAAPSEWIEISQQPNRPPEEPQLFRASALEGPAMDVLRKSAEDGARAYYASQAALPKTATEPEATKVPIDAPADRGEIVSGPAGRSSFSFADVLVFVVCELVAIPMCDAGWHAVVAGEHIGRGVVAIVVGVPIGIVGASFHWWKDKIAPLKREWIERQTLRWWPAALLLAFIYVTAPEIYRRATIPSAAPPPSTPIVIHEPATPEEIAKATAPIQEKLNAAERALADLRSAPPSISSPVSPFNAAAVLAMIERLRELERDPMMGWDGKPRIVVITAPENQKPIKDFIERSIRIALSPNVVQFREPPNPDRDLSAPALATPNVSGIVVHDPADRLIGLLESALSNCFVIKRDRPTPSAVAEYFKVTEPVLWIAIGSGGSPLKSPRGCNP